MFCCKFLFDLIYFVSCLLHLNFVAGFGLFDFVFPVCGICICCGAACWFGISGCC